MNLSTKDEPPRKARSYIHVTDAILHEMADAIVAAVNPVKVLLFGSRANGTASQESDVDLIVVEDSDFSDSHSRFDEINKVRQSLLAYFIPKDVLVYSKSEEEKYARLSSHVLTIANRQGRVLYERK